MSTIAIRNVESGYAESRLSRYAGRSLFSFSKVQLFISPILRGKRWAINKDRIKDKVLLNVGCGPHIKNDFINLEYQWRPGIDICWDITTKNYPLPSRSLEGVYTEHCLEHITFEQCLINLREFHRLLKPGGAIRIIVPDAELYFDLYQAKKADKSVQLPYSKNEETPVISINRIFRGHGHLFIYDFETLALLLDKAGFRDIRKESFNSGRDPRLLIDLPDRAVESLYVEASR